MDTKGAYTFLLYNIPPGLKIFLKGLFLFFYPFYKLDKIKVDGHSCYPQHFKKVNSPTVLQGFTQKEGVDFNDVFSHVVIGPFKCCLPWWHSSILNWNRWM